jgi:hypothetical protein
MKLRYNLTVLFCLCAVQLFSLKYITLDMWQVIYDLIVCLLAIQVFEYNILSPSGKGMFHREVMWLMVIPFLSAIPAYIYHGQNFIETFLAARPCLLMLFFFYIRKKGLPVEKIESLFMYFGVAVAGIYIVQAYIYPTVFFQQLRDQDVLEREGVVRIFIQDPIFIAFALFLLLNRLLSAARMIDFFLFGLCLAGTFFTGTRQVIFSTLGCLLLFFITALNFRSKRTFVILLVSAIFAAGFLALGGLDYIFRLIELTNDQKVTDNDYIRFQEANFYMTTYMPSWVSYIIGNGYSYGASAYGKEIFRLEVDQNLFRSDIGLIGALNMFGAVYLLPVVSIYRKVFKVKLFDRRYYKFFFLYLLLTSFTGGNYFLTPWTFTILFLLLYNIEAVTIERGAIENVSILRNVTAAN